MLYIERIEHAELGELTGLSIKLSLELFDNSVKGVYPCLTVYDENKFASDGKFTDKVLDVDSLVLYLRNTDTGMLELCSLTIFIANYLRDIMDSNTVLGAFIDIHADKSTPLDAREPQSENLFTGRVSFNTTHSSGFIYTEHLEVYVLSSSNISQYAKLKLSGYNINSTLFVSKLNNIKADNFSLTIPEGVLGIGYFSSDLYFLSLPKSLKYLNFHKLKFSMHNNFIIKCNNIYIFDTDFYAYITKTGKFVDIFVEDVSSINADILHPYFDYARKHIGIGVSTPNIRFITDDVVCYYDLNLGCFREYCGNRPVPDISMFK